MIPIAPPISYVNMFPQNYKIVQPFKDLLPDNDLVTCSVLNQFFSNELEEEVANRKINYILNYFYRPHTHSVCIQDTFRTHYDRNVSILFQMLPELFQFINDQNITSLHLECVTSYGGYPQYISEWVPNASEIFNQLIELIIHNTTLLYINIGLFSLHVHKDILPIRLYPNQTLNTLCIIPTRASRSVKEKYNLSRIEGQYRWV